MLALVLIIYFLIKRNSTGETVVSYNLAVVEKNTVISTISGSGQVSASNQVEVKAKASGDVYNVPVKVGQTVKTGAALAYLNAKEALKTVRDAQMSLETAQLSLQKLKQPTEELTLTQAENALAQAQESKIKAEDNVIKAYEDSFNTISDVFLDLPTIITGLNEILNGNQIGETEIVAANYDNASALMNNLSLISREKLEPYQLVARRDYATARSKYDINFLDYKNITRYSDQESIEKILAETLETAKAIAQAAKSSNNYLDTWVNARTDDGYDTFSKVTSYQSDLSSYIGKVNSGLSSLLSSQRSIQDYKEAVVNADRTIQEKTLSLENLKAGTDILDLRSQELSVQQKINALADAREKLADYTVRAPIDGVVVDVSVKKGDSLSSGGTVATIITTQKIASMTLNEIDVTKVKTGQKATITFDAIEDLTVAGQVTEVDAIGTASQGVVSYGVTIGFDTQDERIKTSMSLNASIIIDSKVDVLAVPNTAIKTKGDINYVQVLTDSGINANNLQGIITDKILENRTVLIGLADDTNTEIASGLTEGEYVVIKTITTTAAAKNSSSAPSLLQSLGTGGRGSQSRASSSSSGNATKASVTGGDFDGPPPGM